MRGRLVSILALLVLVAVLATMACKSVNTTSAILRNQEGNYDMAIALCKEELAKNPNDAEAHFQMGFAYSKLDSVALAYQHFIKAKELDPKKEKLVADNIQSNFAKHYKLGQNAGTRGDFKTAANEFDLATQADPRQAIGWFNLGSSYFSLAASDTANAMQDYEKALTAADKVLSISNPSEQVYSRALTLAGKSLVQLGREEDAVERFQRMIEEDPANYAIIQDIGNDLLKAGSWKGAAIFLKMTADARAKVAADDANVYYNLGVAYYNMRDTDPNALNESVMYYQKSLDLQPDDPATVLNMVLAYTAAEDWQQVTLWGEKLVSLNPNDPTGWRLLAVGYQKLGDMDKFKETMDRYDLLKGSK
jgi:tetratricopeptide (TPR) repeat protein